MTRLSLVVPCFNEEHGVRPLVAALRDACDALAPRYAVEILFVDDGSVDETAAQLEAACRALPAARVLRHARNRGLGAALRTGFAAATGELIATTDSDCTYDPRELPALLRLIEAGADVALASPYHPQGRVEQVPAYRLVLSRTLSWLYRAVTGASVHTYTSLFRVYRAEVIRTVRFESDGFLAMAELAVGALLAGFRVAEHPACLRVRQYGASKAAIARLIRDHARFLWRLARQGTRVPEPRAPQPIKEFVHDATPHLAA